MKLPISLSSTEMVEGLDDSSKGASTSGAPQIRHCGYAQVRGKIRRVWRDRYLELWENGLVRYYEMAPTTATTTTAGSSGEHHLDDWNHHHHQDASEDDNNSESHQYTNRRLIAKYTLAVFSARILDVTTFRDMHTGLPRGCFGFLFHGQRLIHLELEEQAAAGGGGSSVTIPLPSVASGSGTSSSPVSQYMAATAAASTTSSSGTPHHLMSSFTAACHQDTVKDQRDYLCAVHSLEEAQMWVYALKWASEQLKMTAIPAEPWWSPTVQEGDDGQARQRILSSCSSWEHAELSLSSSTQRSAPPVPASYPYGPMPPSKQLPSVFRGAGTSSSRRVVTKVTGYQFVRVSRWSWDVAFDVHAMLVGVRKSSKKVQNKERFCKQWTCLRTAADLQKLLQSLAAELRGTSTTHEQASPATQLTGQLAVVRQLPKLGNKSTEKDFATAVQVVDSLLQGLMVDAAIVNTTALKQFLGWNRTNQCKSGNTSVTTRTVCSILRMIRIHDGQSVEGSTVLRIPENVSTEQCVKVWLQRHKSIRKSDDKHVLQPELGTVFSSSTKSMQAWFLQQLEQRPAVIVGGILTVAGLSTTAIVLPLARSVWKMTEQHLFWYRMPVVSCRLDVMIFSWIGAVGAGHYHSKYWFSSAAQQKQSRPAPTTMPVTGRDAVRAGEEIKKTGKSKTLRPGKVPRPSTGSSDSAVLVDASGNDDIVFYDDFMSSTGSVNGSDSESDGEEIGSAGNGQGMEKPKQDGLLPSPLLLFPGNEGKSCWSRPEASIFHVRGVHYFQDKVKVQSGPAPLKCCGVDVWIADSPERHIARHPSVLGGALQNKTCDVFMVNFLLPFGNFVSYFDIPPLSAFPAKLRNTWTNFLRGDQQYRDARLKLLPVVVEGPWIVKTAVGPGKSPALLGKVIPLQYFFQHPEPKHNKRGLYEVDVILTASSIAKGILSIVKGHTKTLTIAFSFIIEAAEQEELPETVLCSFQVHDLHLEHCPRLPECNLE